MFIVDGVFELFKDGMHLSEANELCAMPSLTASQHWILDFDSLTVNYMGDLDMFDTELKTVMNDLDNLSITAIGYAHFHSRGGEYGVFKVDHNKITKIMHNL